MEVSHLSNKGFKKIPDLGRLLLIPKPYHSAEIVFQRILVGRHDS